MYQADSVYGQQLRAFVTQRNYTAGYIIPKNSSDSGVITNTDDDNYVLSTTVLTLGTILPVLIILVLMYIWSGSATTTAGCLSTRQRRQVRGNEDDKTRALLENEYG